MRAIESARAVSRGEGLRKARRLVGSAAHAIMQPAARKDARRSSPVNEEQVGGEEDEV